jgi:hypothetical protein
MSLSSKLLFYYILSITYHTSYTMYYILCTMYYILYIIYYILTVLYLYINVSSLLYIYIYIHIYRLLRVRAKLKLEVDGQLFDLSLQTHAVYSHSTLCPSVTWDTCKYDESTLTQMLRTMSSIMNTGSTGTTPSANSGMGSSNAHWINLLYKRKLSFSLIWPGNYSLKLYVLSTLYYNNILYYMLYYTILYTILYR